MLQNLEGALFYKISVKWKISCLNADWWSRLFWIGADKEFLKGLEGIGRANIFSV